MSIEEDILTQASLRGPQKTICPSEVARALWPDDWRQHMEEVRKVAFALRDRGKVKILQKGFEVTGDTIKGPMRIQIIESLYKKNDL